MRDVFSYRAKIVIYDLTADVRYTLTQEWDRSPDSITVSTDSSYSKKNRTLYTLTCFSQFQFSEDGTSVFFTAGDEAHVKVFTLPLPPTPPKSTTHPSLPPTSKSPIALTTSHAASSIQTLPNGRLLYTSSSFASPNDIFIIRGLDTPDEPLEYDQLTKIAEGRLSGKGKSLDVGESVEAMQGIIAPCSSLARSSHRRSIGAPRASRPRSVTNIALRPDPSGSSSRAPCASQGRSAGTSRTTPHRTSHESSQNDPCTLASPTPAPKRTERTVG